MPASTAAPTALGDVTNPATGEVTAPGGVREPGGRQRVIGSARAAARAWAATSIAARTQVVFRFRELLNARKDELAAIITAEHGKVLSDALGEVTRGLEVVEFACGIPHLLKGGYSENVSTGVDVHSIRQPLGVVGDHQPVQLPGDGADVVLPDRDRRRQHRRAQAQREGPVGRDLDGRAVDGGRPARRRLQRRCRATRRRSTGCSTTPTSRPISFVGSTPIARYVYERGTSHGKRVQALGGAKNHMVVLPDADLDLAADAAVNAGFGSAGERCMAISRRGRRRPGRRRARRQDRRPHARRCASATARRGCRHGPAGHRARTATRSPSYVDAGEAAGAKLVVDGREVAVDGDGDGFWLGPTLFDHVDAGHGDLHRRDLRSGAVGASASTRTTRPSSWSTPTRTATAPRSSPTTAAPRAGSRTRSRSA